MGTKLAEDPVPVGIKPFECIAPERKSSFKADVFQQNIARNKTGRARHEAGPDRVTSTSYQSHLCIGYGSLSNWRTQVKREWQCFF